MVIELVQFCDYSEWMLKVFGVDFIVGGEMGWYISVCLGVILQGQNVVVFGDISLVVFWFVVGVLILGVDFIIENVGLNLICIGILEVLKQMGVWIEVFNFCDVVGELVGNLWVIYGLLKFFNFGEQIMFCFVDEVLIFSVVVCFCEGESWISGVFELRVKEIDWLVVMVCQFKVMGVDIDEYEDGMIICGG